MTHRPATDVVTAHALRLALLPGWDEQRAADQLVLLAAGNATALRQAAARLERALLERHSHVVSKAVRSLRTAMDHTALRVSLTG